MRPSWKILSRNRDPFFLTNLLHLSPAVEGHRTVIRDEAARFLLHQEERVRAAARTVSKESQALSALFREHRFELMEEACVTAERTVEAFQEEMSQVRKAVRDSEARRNEGLAPLRWVASLTDSSLSYDPNFPIEGGFQLPRTSEQKVLGIVALLRKFFVDSAEEAA